MMRVLTWITFLGCMMTAACSSSPSASATGSGTIGGEPFSASSGELEWSEDEPEIGPLVVISSGSKATCQSGALADPRFLASSTIVEFEVSNGESAVEPGVYTVGGSQQTASASFYANDAVCGPHTPVNATAGTVTLSALSAADVSGSYDFTFPNGDAISGTFSLPACGFAAYQADGGDGQSCH